MNRKIRFGYVWMALLICALLSAFAATALAEGITYVSGGDEACEHDWTDGKVTTVATCSVEGVETYTCSKCGAEGKKDLGLDEDNHVGETEIRNAVAATCAAKGYSGDTYCKACGNKISDGTETEVDLTNHVGETEIRNAVAATCAAKGYSGDTYCKACGNKISDGTETEIDLTNHVGETEIRNAAAATCAAKGYSGDTYCKACGNKISDGEETPIDQNNHDWNDPTYQWADDNASVTATRTCKRDNSHVETETTTNITTAVVEATTESAGKTTYTATFTNAAFSATKEVEIPILKPTEAPTFTISFDTAGGSEIPAITGKAGDPVNAPQAPTRKGFTFTGWDREIPATMPAEDVTIKANWKANITEVSALEGLSSTYAPALKSVLGQLPATVGIKLADGSAATAKLTWSQAGNVDGYSKGAVDGDYRFTPDSLTTDAGNVLDEGVALPVCTLTVQPATYTNDQATYTYRLNDAGEATIIKCELKDKSKTKDKKPVTELVVPALMDKLYPVAHIDDEVFYKFTGLTKLDLPAGLRTIGDRAIAGCEALETLVLPDSLRKYGEDLLNKDDALENLVLRTDLDSVLTAKNSVERTVKEVDAEGKEKEVTYKLKLPKAATDFIVHTNTLTVDCDFTVASGHAIVVEAEGTLKLNAEKTLNNLSVIRNDGTFSYAGKVITCGGTWKGNKAEKKKGGSFVSDHVYESGVCTGCGLEEEIVVTDLDISYTGTGLTKVYDKTRNVSLKGSDFKISGTQEGHTAVKLTGIRAAYDSAQCGDRKVSVSFTIGGDDAARYRTKDITIKATITPKTLTITPTEGQKKVYGAADPSYFTGKVKGLLSGDTITGKLARESGEDVGKYKITQGTIDAGENYAVEIVDTEFEIEAKSINSTDVGLMTIGNQRYTGKEIEPAITLRFGTLLLKQDTDFTATFTNNTQPGTAKVVLKGKGNYTGERETSFRILKIADTTDPEDSGDDDDDSGSGGTYTHHGFNTHDYTDSDGDDFFDDDDETERDSVDEDDGQTDESVPEEDVGNLIVDEIDYGNVLFDENGEDRGFAMFDEVTEPGQRVLTIIPEPLKDAETGEGLFLSDGVREQYGEQHLRLSTSLVQTLLDKEFTEIVYEIEQADVHIPMASLVSEIVLGPAPTAESDDGTTPEEDLEVVEEVEEMDIAPQTLQVAYYDVCIQQIDEAELTDRERALLEGNPLLAPPYRVRIRVVPVGQEDELPTPDAQQDDMPLVTDAQALAEGENEPVKPVGVKLPEGCYPEGAELMLLPTEDVREVTDGAETIYISIIDEPEDEDLSERTPTEFVNRDTILYAHIPLNADGVYAVSAPEDSLVIGSGYVEDDASGLEVFDDGETDVP